MAQHQRPRAVVHGWPTFPLVLADRFFAIYDDGGRMLIDVFRWDEMTKTPTFEVLRSVPQKDQISTNPTGIVTATNDSTGGFLYKFRPKPGISQIFGKVPVAADIEVRVKDHEMVVTRDGLPMVTMRDNSMVGCAIGVMVGALMVQSAWE